MALTGLWNWTIERLAYRPLRGSFSARAAHFGDRNVDLPVKSRPGGSGAAQQASAPTAQSRLQSSAATSPCRCQIIVIVTAILLAAFWYLVQHTSLGRAQEACEQDRKMAALGIDVATISITFIIGAALAAVAGVMFVIYYGVVNFADGFVPGVKAFTAAVLGGRVVARGGAGRPPDRPHRSVLVVLLHHGLQGCGRIHDPGDRLDIPTLRHSRPARSREGLSMSAPLANLRDRDSRCKRGAIRSGAPQRRGCRARRLRPGVPHHQLPRRIEHQQRTCSDQSLAARVRHRGDRLCFCFPASDGAGRLANLVRPRRLDRRRRHGRRVGAGGAGR